MGWWGTGVMDGDQPLDILADYEKMAGLRGYRVEEGEDDETIYPLCKMTDYVKNKLQDVIKKDLDGWLKIAEDETDVKHRSISAQVGVVVLMAVGGNMTDEYKKKVISYIDQDEWAKEDGERKQVMDDLRDVVRNYKNGEEYKALH